MRATFKLLFFLAPLLILAACRTASPPAPPLPTLLPTRVPVILPVATAITPATAVPSPIPPTAVAAIIAEPTATAVPATPLPTPTAAPTADPYASLTIDALAARTWGGGELQIVDELFEDDDFTRYLITYPSDGLTVYGYINVPHEGTRFPVALVLHGYIDPEDYDTVAYTVRYANALARAGYFVIHPNFRNYPPSDEGPDPYRIGYASDVLNLIAIIREQSQDITGPLRRADGDAIHLMGHSMGGGVIIRVLTVNPAPYLRAAVLYGSMSGDEIRNYRAIKVWSDGNTGDFELAAPVPLLRQISPITFLDRITTPISIHHSVEDQVVPVYWSEDLCDRLHALAHPVECFLYQNQPHTFRGHGDALFMERMIAFFDRH